MICEPREEFMTPGIDLEAHGCQDGPFAEKLSVVLTYITT